VEVEVEDAVELLIADAVLWKGNGHYLYFSAFSKSSRCSAILYSPPKPNI